MGSLYRRGRFWWIKYYVDGRPIRESAKTEKETEARKLLKLREGAAADGMPVSPRADRLRVDHLLRDLLNDYQVNRKRSFDKARRCAGRLSAAFGARRAVSLTTAEIRAYIAARQTEGAANATINRELAALKRAFSLAMANQALRARPYIPMLRESNVRTGFVSDENLNALARLLPDSLKPVLLFAAFSGWRKCEVLGLKWINVDLDRGVVRLEPGLSKGGEGREVYLTGDLVAIFRAQREYTTRLERNQERIIPWVFHRKGKLVRSFDKAWRVARVQIGMPALLFHDLRRTAVRNMVRAGIPERVAMQISGHKTRSIFDRYHIVSEGDLREAARKLTLSRAQDRTQSL
jgi:integrase